MSQPKPPPSPSWKVDQTVKDIGEKQLKYNSPPQSPTYCSETNLRSSTSPCSELLKLDKSVKARPPPLPVKPPKKQLDDTSETLSPVSLSGKVDQIVKTFVTKQLKYNSPQPPTYPSGNALKSSAPPPLLPRVAHDSEQYETGHEELIKEDKPVKARPPPLPKKHLDDMTETLPKPPASPSGKFNQIVKALDEKQLKYNSPPPSPTYCSEILKLQKELSSTSPPLLPRKWVKQDSEECEEDIKDSTSLSNSYEAMTPWSDVCRIFKLKKSPEAVIIDIKAELLYKAIQLYNQLMTEHGGKLQELITELHSIADNLDKVAMGTKIAGLTGGATSVAGGLVAAAAGVILSPVTAGTSLIALTAVGVSVAAAGGITRVSASIVNQTLKHILGQLENGKFKQKIDKNLQEFDDICKDVLGWLKFIREGMELLKQHNLSVLKKTVRNSKRVANVVKLVTGDSDIASLPVGMDCYFTDGKNRLKSSLESNLAKNLRNLAEDLDKGLNELMNIKDVFSELEDVF